MDKDTVDHIAHLAKLELNDDELNLFTQQLTSILKHFEDLSKVNTTGVEPLIIATETEEAFRKDEAQVSFKSEDMLSNAPARAGNLYKVPPVV